VEIRGKVNARRWIQLQYKTNTLKSIVSIIKQMATYRIVVGNYISS
jgi:hypothetical protein